MNRPAPSIVLMIAAGLLPGILAAQFEAMMFESKVPQAQSRQELDSFLDLVQVSEPKQIVILAVRFRERFAKSEFLAQSYRIEMKAHRELEDYQKAIDAGEQALKLNRDDLDTLLTLANVLPNGANKPDVAAGILKKAESYALRALDGISSLKTSRSVPLKDWQQQTAQMRASAHSALGTIALKQGRYSASIAEFEMSTKQSPVADGAQYYMLGLAYLSNGNRFQAKTALKQASKLGPEIVTARAETELAALEQKH